MCVGHRREEEPKKNPEEDQPRAPDEDQDHHQDYSQMFRLWINSRTLLPIQEKVGWVDRFLSEFEAQLIQYRALLMNRLVQDPFYNLMNVSTASRMWMLRYLKHLALYAEQRYHVNLLEFFGMMNSEDVLSFFRHKNAPNEMIEMWEKVNPVPGTAAAAAGRNNRRRHNQANCPN